jgi:hypothetical protein
MQDYLRSKNPHLSRWGAFKKIVCIHNSNHNQPRANGVQTCYKANEEKATSLPPGRAYCKKVWCRQTGICLPDHLPVALSFLSRSALSKACIGMDKMAPIKSLQMPFQELHRGIITATIRFTIFYRTVQSIKS